MQSSWRSRDSFFSAQRNQPNVQILKYISLPICAFEHKYFRSILTTVTILHVQWANRFDAVYGGITTRLYRIIGMTSIRRLLWWPKSIYIEQFKTSQPQFDESRSLLIANMHYQDTQIQHLLGSQFQNYFEELETWISEMFACCFAGQPLYLIMDSQLTTESKL